MASVHQINIVVIFRPHNFLLDSGGSFRALAVYHGNAQLRTHSEIPSEKHLLCIIRCCTVFTISNHFGV